MSHGIMVGSDCGKPVHIEYDGKAYSDAIVDKQPAPDVETFPPGSRDAVVVEEARTEHSHHKTIKISHIPDVPRKVEKGRPV